MTDLDTVEGAWCLSAGATCNHRMLSSRNLELGLKNTGLNLSGTSDDVTSGAVGQYAEEEAHSKPFTWSRNKVGREDRERMAPGRD